LQHYDRSPRISDRTFQFAIRIIKLCQHLEETGSVARTISKQLLRSGTSISANVQEGQAGQSKADLISKNYIALKEARETLYGLKLLASTNTSSILRHASLQRPPQTHGDREQPQPVTSNPHLLTL
jgi:four helix bundle protein